MHNGLSLRLRCEQGLEPRRAVTGTQHVCTAISALVPARIRNLARTRWSHPRLRERSVRHAVDGPLSKASGVPRALSRSTAGTRMSGGGDAVACVHALVGW